MGPGFVAKPKPPPKRTRESVNEERARIAAVRCAKVLTLRKEGWRLKDIGKEMGVSVERVRQMEARGWRIAAFHTPEAIAARERAAKEKAEEEAAREAEWKASERAWEVRKRAWRARGLSPDPEERKIIKVHAEQQLWRQFTEPRRPPVAHPPAWLQWTDTAGITYRDVPGRLVPEWRIRIT